MNCQALERWLDEGMPEPLQAAAQAHAALCPRCAAALRATLELEALLDRPPAAAPAALIERVMARIATAGAERQPVVLPSPFSWWVQAAAQPATALAVALAALVLWQGRPLLAVGSELGVSIGQAAGRFSGLEWPQSGLLANPNAVLGLALALAPAALWAGWALYHWSERLVGQGRLQSKRRA